MGFGARPVVLVVDMVYGFVGHEPEPILESVRTWPNSCGEEGWDGVRASATLIAAARAVGVPIVYTKGFDRRSDGLGGGLWRNSRLDEEREVPGYRTTEIVRELSPEPRDIIVQKAAPSAFYGTPLSSYLVELKADSLLVVGTTTSGCVRATVVDAFSANYRVAVVEEGTFDRGEASHAVSLFDMDQKYADVVSLESARRFLSGLPPDLFADVFEDSRSDG